jgi:hypothetical protein
VTRCPGFASTSGLAASGRRSLRKTRMPRWSRPDERQEWVDSGSYAGARANGEVAPSPDLRTARAEPRK